MNLKYIGYYMSTSGWENEDFKLVGYKQQPKFSLLKIINKKR